MKRLYGLLVRCAPLLALPLTAFAATQIYRWVDADGLVHFTQNPPVSGSYQNVTPPDSVLAGPGAPVKSKSDPQNGSKPNQTTGTLAARADNAERCAKARERISFLEEKTAHRLFRTGDDGQPVRLTDEEFQQSLDDANAAAAKYCE